MTPELVYYSGAELLEGPVFDHKNKLLYFVSIFDHLAHCFDPSTKEMISIKLESPVSCIYILGDKKIMAVSKDGFYEVDFTSLAKTFSFQLDVPDDVRYNDGILDSRGRMIIGTMGYPEIITGLGQVYSYENGLTQTLIEKTTISNGLAFAENDSILYFIDTPIKKVARYSYDINTGTVAFQKYVIEFTGAGSPDGMCIDGSGHLWIAEWGGARVSKWDPASGKELSAISLPCPNVSSCCLDDKNNLYVTTAASDSVNDGLGGGLFYVQLDKKNQES
ncbi:MAG: SMP-30/gluconolactonase/LRE family protein [Flavobacteriaceae bacterium]|nr:SMP-30/gluconolactonase/LRE family protein [Flavobacteriaceae bacterium]